jgi:acyl carrier protein
MPAATRPQTTTPAMPAPLFPEAELERRLREELRKAAEDSEVLHDEWEPVLDSLVVVSVLLEIENLFPSISLPPENIIRQGGYRSIDEGVADISRNLRTIWNKHHQARTGP